MPVVFVTTLNYGNFYQNDKLNVIQWLYAHIQNEKKKNQNYDKAIFHSENY